jgi:hypothetical protein
MRLLVEVATVTAGEAVSARRLWRRQLIGGGGGGSFGGGGAAEAVNDCEMTATNSTNLDNYHYDYLGPTASENYIGRAILLMNSTRDHQCDSRQVYRGKILVQAKIFRIMRLTAAHSLSFDRYTRCGRKIYPFSLSTRFHRVFRDIPVAIKISILCGGTDCT